MSKGGSQPTATEQPSETTGTGATNEVQNSAESKEAKPAKGEANEAEGEEEEVVESGDKAEMGQKLWEPRAYMQMVIDGKKIDLREQIQVGPILLYVC